MERRADAVLVSQVVTQRDVHRRTPGSSSTSWSGSASAAGWSLVLGGPRIDHRLAVELGYDAGFGAGTRPSDVANFIVGAVLRRMGKEH